MNGARMMRFVLTAAVLIPGAIARADLLPSPGLPAPVQMQFVWVSASPRTDHDRLRIEATVTASADTGGPMYVLVAHVPYYPWPQAPIEYLLSRRSMAAELRSRLLVRDGALVSLDTTLHRDGGEPSRETGRDVERVDFHDGTFYDPYFRTERRLPEDTYDPYALLFVGFLGAQFDAPYTFSVWNKTFPSVIVNAAAEATETVTVPAGRFRCYRVRFRQRFEESFRSIYYREHPHDSVAGMAAQFAGQIGTVVTDTAWFRVDPPHILVRVDGLVGAAASKDGRTLVLESMESTTSP